MPIDEELLVRHRSFEDRAAGLREEFLQPTIGSGSTVAVLSTPLGKPRPTGWVLCHSFGMEQIYLSRLEVILARALARAGFPVLRYHGQGYGDSEAGMRHAGLSSHVADATDAVALLQDRPGVERVGVFGARFGGLVAAVVADRGELPFMALVEPIVRGGQYMRDFLRTRIFSEMVRAEENGHATGMDGLRREVSSRGWADIRGFALGAQGHDEISGVDLTTELTAFRGEAHLLSVSRTGRASPAVDSLAARLRSLGAACETEVLEHRMAGQFGQHHHRNEAGNKKTDTQFEVYQSVAERVAAWILRTEGLASSRDVAS